MAEPIRSVPDIAEQLMHEFQSACSASTVTEVVIRLSRPGTVSLATLADAARRELSELVGALTSDAENLPDAAVP